MRIRDYGIQIGSGRPGPLNRITDVPGVTVGHCTINEGDHHTGVTVIFPCEDNMFSRKLVAASFVLNGFGKTCGLVQVDELGTLETPIALTNTLCVGRCADALISYMTQWCEREGVSMHSINPVVGECNDAGINRITDRAIQETHVWQAIESRCRDFKEGCVGAGTGTICHGLKGGIGSSSRQIRIGEKTYTIGILVQSNHGSLERLQINGDPIGQRIRKQKQQTIRESDQGSIMMILATDLPVSDRQLRRMLKRCGAGLARLGSYYGHGSGDVMIGFSTENRIQSGYAPVVTRLQLSEEWLEIAFQAVADATEEAVLNSLTEAIPMRKLTGEMVETLGQYLHLKVRFEHDQS